MSKKKRPDKKPNGIAKALAHPVFRQRVKPSKKAQRLAAREKFYGLIPEDTQ